MLVRNRISALAILIMVLSCSQSRQHESELFHDQGRFVNDSNSLQWMTLSNDEIIDFVSKSFLDATGRQQEIIDADDQHQRMIEQTTVDFVAHFSSPSPAVEIPQPFVFVVNDSSLNAAAFSAYFCFKVSIIQEGLAAETQDEKFVTFQEDAQPQYISASGNCYERDGRGMIKDLADRLHKIYPQCAFTVEGESIRVGLSCPLAQKPAGVLLPAMVNIIKVHSAVLNHPEDSIQSILTHELSHYTLAHGAQHPSLYNYFYSEADQIKGQKPAKRDDLKSLGQRYMQIMEPGRFNLPARGKISMNPLFFLYLEKDFLTRLDFSFCENAEGEEKRYCENSPCLALTKSFEKWRDVPFKSIESKYGIEELESLAQKTRACWVQEMPPIDTSLSQAIRATLNMTKIDFTKVSIPINVTIAEAFDQMDVQILQAIDDHNAAYDLVLDEVKSRQLGWYTMEQEADELGAEWMRANKKDPLSSLVTILDTYNPKACDALLGSDWRVQPKLPYVPFGDDGYADDTHHSLCYRIYNLKHEEFLHP